MLSGKEQKLGGRETGLVGDGADVTIQSFTHNRNPSTEVAGEYVDKPNTIFLSSFRTGVGFRN